MHRQAHGTKQSKGLGAQKGLALKKKAKKVTKSPLLTAKAKKTTTAHSSHSYTTQLHSPQMPSFSVNLGLMGKQLKTKKAGMSFSTSSKQHSTITSQRQHNVSGIAPQFNHPAFRHLGHLNGMAKNTTPTQPISVREEQKRAFSSTLVSTTASQTTPSTRKINSTFKSSLPPTTYQQKLRKMILKSRDPAIKTVSSRQIMTAVKVIMNQIISSVTNVVAALKTLTNPFRNKRGNTISLDGSVPWQYHVRNALMVTAIGGAALLGGYVLIKSLLLALKVGLVVVIFNFLRKKLIEHSLKRGDLDRAIMFETWGESHSNDNLLAKICWAANPISWAKQIHYYLSIDRRKQERSRELAGEVTKQITRDTRMQHLFGSDYFIGEMDRNVGEMGLEEESTYAGFITIPIYSSAPTIIDIASSNNRTRDNNKHISGTNLSNEEALQKHSKQLDAEFTRRMTRKYGKNAEGHSFNGSMEILDEIKQEHLDAIDPNEDIDYKYKFYKALPKWKWDEMDPDDQQSVIQGKKEAYYNNRNIQSRINIFDFESISTRWSKQKWDFRKDKLHSRDGIMLPTADPELAEVGVIYAFFSVPALDNAVGEKNNRISIDAMNVLTQGTLLPFELEKVFVVGEKVEKFTLFHKDVAKWSINPSLTKDRTLQTYRKTKRDEQEAQNETAKADGRSTRKKKQAETPSQTRVVDFDLLNNKPVVEAEVVHAETVDYGSPDNNSGSSSSSPDNSKDNVVEAQILKK